MKLNIDRVLGRPFNVDTFVADVEDGVVHDKFPPNPGIWRVSTLVQLWDEGCEKLLYLYLKHGGEKEFDTEVVKTFHLGTSIHDIVKEYFRVSPHFQVKHEELGIKHRTLPITGTMDLVVEWDKYPGQEFIVEIKSSNTDYINRPIYGARYKPFKKHRWQAGLYSTIYGAPAIVLYYDKNNSEMYSHLLKKEDYEKDVNTILSTCSRIWDERVQELGSASYFPLPMLPGICKNKPKASCHMKEHCDVGCKI